MTEQKNIDTYQVIMYHGIVSDIARQCDLSINAVWNFFKKDIGGDLVKDKINAFINSPYYMEKEKQFKESEQTQRKWQSMKYHGCIKDIIDYTGLSHFVISQAINKGIVNDIDVTLKINKFFSQVDLKQKMKPAQYIEYLESKNKF